MSGRVKIAIIGAGIAGLACARRLADGGSDPVIFDKGRGVGGRIATRRGPLGSFDHGAVGLSAADVTAGRQGPFARSFAGYLAAAEVQGAVAWWPAGQDWVGLPGMSASLRPLAQGLHLQVGLEVTGLQPGPQGWLVQTKGGAVPDRFDQVVLAIPQPQAMALLTPWPGMQSRIAGARMRAVWTAMARFAARLPLDGDLLTPTEGPVAMAIRNSAKPGRDEAEAWVIHAGPDWTATRLEQDKPEAAALLLAAFFAEFGLQPVVPVTLEGHRWRYGLTAQALGQAFVRDAGLGLSVCGDWCLGDRASDGFASGSALADALLDRNPPAQ